MLLSRWWWWLLSYGSDGRCCCIVCCVILHLPMVVAAFSLQSCSSLWELGFGRKLKTRHAFWSHALSRLGGFHIGSIFLEAHRQQVRWNNLAACEECDVGFVWSGRFVMGLWKSLLGSVQWWEGNLLLHYCLLCNLHLPLVAAFFIHPWESQCDCSVSWSWESFLCERVGQIGV